MQWLIALVPALLRWFFDGRRVESSVSSPSPAGLDDLDRTTVAGQDKLWDYLPLLAGGVLMACVLSGCPAVNIGGSVETLRVVMVEPGSTIRIATDREIDVLVPLPAKIKPDPTGGFLTGSAQTEIEWKPAKKNVAGMYAMPKSVYEELVQKARRAEALERQNAELQASLTKLTQRP
jgi:hypothetical protein